jgi:hypothetical protein
VDYCPQKEDPHQIRITAGGSLVKYDSSPSVNTADLDTRKLHWDSIISTRGAKYLCLDIKNFYLMARLYYFEYMHMMPLTFFPSWIQEQYNLAALAYKGIVHLEMRQAVWGLPQAGILANKCLWCKLALFSYYKHIKTPGHWYHKTQRISFTLVVDDFGVKYVSREDIDHLIGAIKLTYTLTKDWTGNVYCGIALDWDYNNRTVNISMPGYIKKNCKSIIM